MSVAAVKLGKVECMTGIMRKLAGIQGGPTMLASVGFSAAAAGMQRVADMLAWQSAHRPSFRL